MNLNFANFWRFLSFELKGHSNYNQDLTESDPVIDSNFSDLTQGSNCSDSVKSSSTYKFTEDGLRLDLNLMDKRNLTIKDNNDSTYRNGFLNYDFILSSIPQNYLAHMVRLPYYFERLIYHSVGICFDSLLFELTFMPIQAITSITHFISCLFKSMVREVRYMFENELVNPVRRMFNHKDTHNSEPYTRRGHDFSNEKSFETVRSQSSFKEPFTRMHSTFPAHRCLTLTEVCGCVRFFVLLSTVYIFSFLDTSKVYHNIKGQPLMKLYVIFNMLEICERLCRSFSRDIMDSLIRTTIKIYLAHFSQEEVSLYTESSAQFGTTNDNVGVNTHHADLSLEITRNSAGFIHKDMLENMGFRSDSVLNEFGTVAEKDNKSNEVDNKSESHSERHRSQKGSKKSNKKDKSDSKGNKSTSKDSLRNSAFTSSKSNYLGGLESFVWSDNIGSILNSCRKYSASFNIYYKFVSLFLFVVFTISFHSFLHLVRVLSLNIAINSPESTMFLLLITNNFSEIKSTVFKKHDKLSLFVIFASDAAERCYLFLDGLLVFLKMSSSKRNLRYYVTVLSWLAVIYSIEMAIDLFKHGYLIKFNRIGSDTFEKYNSTLVSDSLLSRSVCNVEKLTYSKVRVPCKGSFSFSHISSRRIGFMTSPLATLILCSLPKMFTYLTLKTFATSLFIWLSLLSIKASTSILLTAYAIKRRSQIYDLDSSFYRIGAL